MRFFYSLIAALAFFIHLLVFPLAYGVTAAGAAAPAGAAAEKLVQAGAPGVTLVYASHLADIQRRSTSEGLPELYTLLAGLRGDGGEVLFLLGGNVLGPSPLSSFDKGAHIIGLLNQLEPTVMTLGRRDFMHKEDELALRASEAVFPFVCSNMQDSASGEPPVGTVRQVLLDAGGLKIACISLISPEVVSSYRPEKSLVTGGYAVLPGLVKDARAQGATLVIASADFKPDDPEAVLKHSGADILFYGSGSGESSYARYGNALYAKQGKEDEVLVMRLVPTSPTGKATGSVKVGKGSASAATPPATPAATPAAPPAAGAGNAPAAFQLSEEKVVRLSDYAAAKEVEAPIKEYTASVTALLNVPVGVLETPVATETKTIRTEENAWANLVTDSLREYYSSDIGAINAGGLRGNQRYPAGTTLTRKDLQTEMPLHDTSCLIDTTGAALLAALEHAVGDVENARGKFLHVSGMHYTFDASAAPGKRIGSVTVGNAPLDPAKTYTMTLPSYLAGGGDGYTMFGGVCRTDAPRPPQEIVEIVRVYISSKGTVAPKCEGRILRVK